MTIVSPDAFAEARALLIAGRAAAALTAFRALVDGNPNAPNLRYWLGSALAANGDAAAAADAWATARIFHSLALMRDLGVDMEHMAAHPAYAAEVGRQLLAQGLPGVAASALAKASEAASAPEALTDYGLSLAGLGEMASAFEALQAADMLQPTPDSHARLIALHTFVHDGGAGRVAAAHAWGRTYAPRLASPPPALTGGRPLKVGYLAASFHSESLQRHALPAIANHDPALVYPILYLADGAGAPVDDQIRPLDGLDDHAAAQAIRADGLDILVDLAGHSPGGRLGVLALRPAPIQVAWSRDPYTTGLAAFDHLLQAGGVGDEASDTQFVEAPWNIGPVSAPYRPAPETRAAEATPALAKGYPTFAFFGAPAWLGEATVALWGRLLVARPDARLILKHGLFDDPVVQRQTGARFAALGVAPERIDFRGQTSGDFHAAEFADVDLGLLPAACVEAAPLMEMLAHGVPVLAVDGGDFQSRAAAQALRACRLDGLISNRDDALVGVALRLTENLAMLDTLRRETLVAFEASPFRDEAGFARRLEAAYAQMVEARIERAAVAA